MNAAIQAAYRIRAAASAFCHLFVLLYFIEMSLFPSARSLDYSAQFFSSPAFFLSFNLFLFTTLISLGKKHQDTEILFLASVCLFLQGHYNLWWFFWPPWDHLTLSSPGLLQVTMLEKSSFACSSIDIGWESPSDEDIFDLEKSRARGIPVIMLIWEHSVFKYYTFWISSSVVFEVCLSFCFLGGCLWFCIKEKSLTFLYWLAVEIGLALFHFVFECS